MLRNVFLKTLRDRRKSLFWWSLGLAGFISYILAVWPSVQDSAEAMKEYMESLPKAVTAALSMSEATQLFKPEGFLSVEVFNFMGPLLLLFFTIGLGASAIAKEEDEGTLDLLLSYPIPRWRLVLEEFAALLVSALLLSTVLCVILLVGVKAVDMDINIWRLVQALISQYLFIVAFGTVALALGCSTGKRGLSIGVTTVVAVASYFMNALAPLSDTLEPLQKASLFYYYVGAEPLKNGIDLGHAAVLVGVTIISLVVALLMFQRRDLAT